MQDIIAKKQQSLVSARLGGCLIIHCGLENPKGESKGPSESGHVWLLFSSFVFPLAKGKVRLQGIHLSYPGLHYCQSCTD